MHGVFSTRYSVVKRKSIVIPEDALPCCPTHPSDHYGLQSPQNTPDMFDDNIDMSGLQDLDMDFSFDGMDASKNQHSGHDIADGLDDNFLFSQWPPMPDLPASNLISERADRTFDISASSSSSSVMGFSSMPSNQHLPSKAITSNPGDNLFDLGIDDSGLSASPYQRPRSNPHDTGVQNQGQINHHSHQPSGNAYGSTNNALDLEQQSQLPGYGTSSPPPTPTTQTTIKLDGAEPSTVAAIMDILIKSKAKVKFETQ